MRECGYLEVMPAGIRLSRPDSSPGFFGHVKSCFNYICRTGLEPIYVNDMVVLYSRLREAYPIEMHDAQIRVNKVGALSLIRLTLNRTVTLVNLESLTVPRSLPASDVIDYLTALRQTVGYWPYALGSAASHLYTFFREFKTQAPVLDPEVSDFVRSSFIGGFNCLKPGVYEVNRGYIYDINQMYAYILKSCWLPYGDPESFDGEPPDRKYSSFYFHRFKASFSLRPGKLPFVQLVHDWGRPSGYQSYSSEPLILTMAEPDFKLFKSNYRITSYEPLGGYIFNSCNIMFEEYIGMLRLKREGAKSKGEELAYKNLGNALFGQHGRKDIIGRTVYKDGLFIRDEDYKQLSRAYVPVASAVSAYARSLIIPAAQREGSNFIYSDTDSIHTHRKSRYIIPSKDLGRFKLEAEFKRARYFGRRKYIMELPDKLKITLAGLPSGSADRYSYDELVRGFEIPTKIRHVLPDGSIEITNSRYVL